MEVPEGSPLSSVFVFDSIFTFKIHIEQLGNLYYLLDNDEQFICFYVHKSVAVEVFANVCKNEAKFQPVDLFTMLSCIATR